MNIPFDVGIGEISLILGGLIALCSFFYKIGKDHGETAEKTRWLEKAEDQRSKTIAPYQWNSNPSTSAQEPLTSFQSSTVQEEVTSQSQRGSTLPQPR